MLDRLHVRFIVVDFLMFVALVFIFTHPFTIILDLGLEEFCVYGYEVGVAPGDWIYYEINWTRTPLTNFPFWIRREVLAVVGSNITIEIEQGLSNGTIEKDIGWGDIVDGTGATSLVFIPSDSLPGDIIFIEGFDPVRISGSTQRAYLGIYRTVLWTQFSSMGIDVMIFWDKETGVALEILHERSLSKGVTKVVDTNLWIHDSQNSDNQYGLVVLASIVIILGLVFALRRYFSKRSAR